MSFKCPAPNQRAAFYLRSSLSCHFSVPTAVNFHIAHCILSRHGYCQDKLRSRTTQGMLSSCNEVSFKTTIALSSKIISCKGVLRLFYCNEKIRPSSWLLKCLKACLRWNFYYIPDFEMFT